MGFLDRLLGREEQPRAAYTPPAGYDQPGYQPQAPSTPAGQAPSGAAAAGPGASGRSEDEIAVERYRYLLRTAPPETIEQVHEEAFTKLTPDQRALLFRQLSENAPAGEAPRGDDPRSLAQSATRSELRQPGTLERTMAPQGGGGMGFGGMFASSLLGSVAGYVIGSALVSAFLPGPADMQADQGTTGDQGDQSGDQGDQNGDQGGGDQGADAGATDAGAGDVNADAGWGGDGGWGGDAGGDFGGGDFGGGFDF